MGRHGDSLRVAVPALTHSERRAASSSLQRGASAAILYDLLIKDNVN